MDWPVGFEPPAAPVKASEEKFDVSAEEEEEALTVSVKLWTALGEMLFDAVMVIGNEPLAVGVPLRMPALNVTPGGSAPDSVSVVVGVPVAVSLPPGGPSRWHHQTHFSTQSEAQLCFASAGSWRRPADHSGLTRTFQTGAHSRLPASLAQAPAGGHQSARYPGGLQPRWRQTFPEA